MALIHIERHPRGLRCHLLGRRVHHWQAGVGAICWGVRAVWRDLPDLLDTLLRTGR